MKGPGTVRAILSGVFTILVSSTIGVAAAPQAPVKGQESISPIIANEINDRSPLIAQFLTDDRENAAVKQKESSQQAGTEVPETRPQFMMGISGALSNMEGFANVSVASILGIQYGKFSFTADPAFIFSRAKSLKNKKDMIGAKSSGELLELGLPLRCTFSFLDPSSYGFSPYLQAGFGYDLRKYIFSGSSFFTRINNSYFIDSLTLNFGFGFIIKMTEQTRLRIGLSGVSYFNSKQGAFGYETTGASMLLGLTAIFD
jgi:hypothetical protein